MEETYTEQYTTTCGTELPAVDPNKNFPLVFYKVSPDWDEFLRMKNPIEIAEIDDDFKKKIAQAACTMYYNGGIGIAANQVGFKENWFIMDTAWIKTGVKSPRVMLNPNPTESYLVEAPVMHEGEGCLSIPLGFRGNVPRHPAVTLTYTNLKNESEEFVATDLDAFCIMHELDHLCGRLFIDYISKLRMSFLEKKLQKVKKAVMIRVKNHNRAVLEQVKKLNIMAAWGYRPDKHHNEALEKSIEAETLQVDVEKDGSIG
jgi:peptide deformylase